MWGCREQVWRWQGAGVGPGDDGRVSPASGGQSLSQRGLSGDLGGACRAALPGAWPPTGRSRARAPGEPRPLWSPHLRGAGPPHGPASRPSLRPGHLLDSRPAQRLRTQRTGAGAGQEAEPWSAGVQGPAARAGIALLHNAREVGRRKRDTARPVRPSPRSPETLPSPPTLPGRRPVCLAASLGFPELPGNWGTSPGKTNRNLTAGLGPRNAGQGEGSRGLPAQGPGSPPRKTFSRAARRCRLGERVPGARVGPGWGAAFRRPSWWLGRGSWIDRRPAHGGAQLSSALCPKASGPGVHQGPGGGGLSSCSPLSRERPRSGPWSPGHLPRLSVLFCYISLNKPRHPEGTDKTSALKNYASTIHVSSLGNVQALRAETGGSEAHVCREGRPPPGWPRALGVRPGPGSRAGWPCPRWTVPSGPVLCDTLCAGFLGGGLEGAPRGAVLCLLQVPATPGDTQTGRGRCFMGTAVTASEPQSRAAVLETTSFLSSCLKPKPPPSPAAQIGPNSCPQCHRKRCSGWDGSGYRSLQKSHCEPGPNICLRGLLPPAPRPCVGAPPAPGPHVSLTHTALACP